MARRVGGRAAGKLWRELLWRQQAVGWQAQPAPERICRPQDGVPCMWRPPSLDGTGARSADTGACAGSFVSRVADVCWAREGLRVCCLEWTVSVHANFDIMLPAASDSA